MANASVNAGNFKRKFWRTKEERGPLSNLAFTFTYFLVAFLLFRLGLAEGRADPSAPFLFDSPDTQTLIASAFIGLAAYALFSGLRLALFTAKLIADLKQGPTLLVGYVTTRETRRWRRKYGKERLSYRLYLVSRHAFPIWLRGTAAPENELAMPLGWSAWSRSLPAVVPNIFLVPDWAYERVREGDLVRLHYARWRRAVLDVEIIESVLPPLSNSSGNKSKKTPSQIEPARWRVIEPDS
jgi:hypothetical protein